MIKERGLQKIIADKTGLHHSTVSNYFNSKYVCSKTVIKIEKCLSEMGRNHMINHSYSKCSIDKVKNIRRIDILNNLEYGDQIRIAKILNITPQRVNLVLNSSSEYMNHNTEKVKNIIREAELIAAINIWKSKFCMTESLI